MTIDYEQLMSLRREGDRFRYGDRETMLYALSVGFGRDPLDERELDFVFERAPLKTVPSMAAVVAHAPLLRSCGLDQARVLHGEQRLTMHRPLPPEGELVADSRVTAVWDKGAGKGALIVSETAVRSAADAEPMFTLARTTFARGDGGFGGPAGSGPLPHPVPERTPDLRVPVETRPDQALLYRLNGDRNPLHADPGRAKRVGFDAPILHGLCTYGTCCRALLAAVCHYDHTLITGFDVRFSAPVYPGERIVVDLWVDGGIVSFRARVPDREVTVIDHGKCTLRS